MKGAQIAILVFDLKNPKSFDEISFWVNEVKTKCDPEPVIHICGNKDDLKEQ
jgi:GTPase SAR1 family protein